MKYKKFFYLATVLSVWASHGYAMNEGETCKRTAMSGVPRTAGRNLDAELKARLEGLPDEERRGLGRLARDNLRAAAQREEQRVEEAVRRVMALGPKGGGSASAAGAAEASSSTTEVH